MNIYILILDESKLILKSTLNFAVRRDGQDCKYVGDPPANEKHKI